LFFDVLSGNASAVNAFGANDPQYGRLVTIQPIACSQGVLNLHTHDIVKSVQQL
jgi:hypothetical protein